MSATVTVTGLTELIADLDHAQSRMLPEAKKVITRAALNIKTDAARRAGGLKHAPAYPRSITYDVASTLSGVHAEIGPDKDRRQGALGNLIEFGSVHNAPRPHLGPAQETEEGKLVQALDDLLFELLE